MLEEEGAGDLASVAHEIEVKLIRRHPHIFADAVAETPKDVKSRWERIKVEQEGRQGIFHDVPAGFPALLYAKKLQQRAASVGFDWDSASEAFPKIAEEHAELAELFREAAEAEAAAAAEPESSVTSPVHADPHRADPRVAHEVGDLLFATVNVARLLHVDPELALPAARRFAELLSGIDPSSRITSRLTDLYVKKYPEISLSITHPYIEKYIGESISSERVEGILTSLGFTVSVSGANYTVQVPSWRSTKDVTIKVDLIEEITRIYGYNNITPRSPYNPLIPVKQPVYHEAEYRVKQLLAESCGMNELHSYIWNDTRFNEEVGIESKGVVKVVNAISPEQSEIRSSLIPSLIKSIGPH
jgi:NTP pyrophosphatase (non-canonical NTP hydrolase)